MSPALRASGVWAFAALCLASLAACTRAAEDYATTDAYYEVTVAEDAGGAPQRAPSSTAGPLAPSAGQRAPVLLRRAELSMRVDDYAEAAAALPGLVSRFDAYMAGERERRTAQRVSNTYTIRVAAAQFDSLLAAVARLAEAVDGRTVTVDDVTEEFVDLEARLRARRAVEERYVALLARADKVTDVIAVQQQLAQVREEIERAEGRMRYLTDRAAMSTVEVTLYETTPDALAGGSFFHDLAEAFGMGWRGLLTVLVAAAATWPLWLAVVFALFLWNRVRASRPQKRARPLS